jgi:PilZ domain
MQEHRHVSRRPMLKPGKIVTANATDPIECMVYDLTHTGAGIRISPEDVVPDHFELVIDTAQTHQDCKVLWRHNERLGVEFAEKA